MAVPRSPAPSGRPQRSTGTSFEYLLTTAQIESSLNPAAQAATSSAKGLYQFIDQTWLATMKSAGAALGLWPLRRRHRADRRAVRGAGPAMRSTIMQLRSDPAASALMAGAFARNNAAQLAQAIGRSPTEGELYIAHFLGADGAGKLIGAVANQPQANAAAMFPQAAAANPSIFYTGSGSSRSVGDVYAKLTGRFEFSRNLAFNTGLRGSVAPATDTAGVTQAFAAVSSAPAMPDARPLFLSMFADRAQAVTQKVNQLWTQPGTGTSRPVSLFTDRPAAAPRKPTGS